VAVDSKKRTDFRGNYNSDSVKPWLLCFILACGILLIITQGMSLRVERLINFEILILIALAVYVHGVNKPLGLVLGFVAVMIPFHPAIDIEVMYAITAYSVFYLIVTSKRWKLDWIWNVICVAAILNVVWQVLQYSGIWWLQTPFGMKTPQYIGLLSNTNETSIFLAVCLPCFFRKGWEWLIPVPLIGLYLGVSYGGIVAASVAGMVYLTLNIKELGWKKSLIVLVSAILVFSIYTIHKQPNLDRYLNDRGRYWAEMLPIVWQKPLGWGLGQFKYVMPLIQTPTLISQQGRVVLYQNVGDKRGFEQALQKVSGGDRTYFATKRWNEIWLEAHNEYMEIWFALGLTGLLLVLCSIGDTLWKKGDDIPKYGFLISCISAIWFFSWQIVPIALISITYMGVIHAKNT
jgi:hypothetical protein